jgi:hypothetical protein
MPYRGKLEYAQQRKLRERNTPLYRLAHWPIWIWVFFLAPGPLTFSLFAHGFGRGNLAWLALVLLGTGVSMVRGSLPGCEPRPYILRFDEDKPNPLYRRVCYTYAPLCVTILLLGALGQLPRVGPSTKGEGTERRYFYGSVWAVVVAQTLLMVVWKALPNTRFASLIKLAIFCAALLLMAYAAYRGVLLRTRPIIPGESMVAD